MINYYQPFLLPFLKLKPDDIPAGLICLYYHSFEDGLWDLLQHRFPGRRLKFLVPDFYCSDVLDNLKNRGHRYIYYPLDRNFQISVSQFKKYLWLNRPDVVIIFHACGITSRLFDDTSWLADLPPHSLIIEDSVHRLLDPRKIKLLSDRHFVIDSLRKVSPLPGSRLFGSPAALSSFTSHTSYFNRYFMLSSFYYLLFRFVLALGFVINSAALVSLAHQQLLKTHDDLIGDSFTPQPGLPVFLPLIHRLNYAKLNRLKKRQVTLYRRYFRSIFSSPWFYQPDIPVSDYPHLHIFPLGFTRPPSSDLARFLRLKHLPVWFKFLDTPWSQSRGVLFLPLGFHVSASDIRRQATAFSYWASMDINSRGAVVAGAQPVFSV